MGHGLRSTDSLFYVGEVPWHGLGTPLPSLATAQEALEAARLDWTVEKRELRDSDYRRVHRKLALVRSDTGECLGVVSPRYEPLQNTEAFRFFDEVTMDPNGPKYEVAGSLGGGRIVWILARIPGFFELVKGEVHQPYLLLANGHDGRMAVHLLPTVVRVVCQNTLQMALHGAKLVWRRTHRQSLTELDVWDARHVLGLVEKEHTALAEFYGALLKEKATPVDVSSLLRYVYGSNASSRRERLILNLLEAGPGCDNPRVRGTLYALLNAITDMEDHYWLRPSVQDVQEARSRRLDSVMFGEGEQRKRRAVRWMKGRLQGAVDSLGCPMCSKRNDGFEWQMT
jgi:phage/plasmid-like protein (TIGR03299 family)